MLHNPGGWANVGAIETSSPMLSANATLAPMSLGASVAAAVIPSQRRHRQQCPGFTFAERTCWSRRNEGIGQPEGNREWGMPTPRSAPKAKVHKPAGLNSASLLNRAGTMRACSRSKPAPGDRPVARFPSLDTGGRERLSAAQPHLPSPVNAGPTPFRVCASYNERTLDVAGQLGNRDAETPRAPSAIPPVSPASAGEMSWAAASRATIAGQALDDRRSQPYGRSHGTDNFAVGLSCREASLPRRDNTTVSGMRHLHLSGLARQANLIAPRVADTWRPAARRRSVWSNGLGRGTTGATASIGKVEKAPEANPRIVVIGQARFALARILQHLFALGPG